MAVFGSLFLTGDKCSTRQKIDLHIDDKQGILGSQMKFHSSNLLTGRRSGDFFKIFD